jgi:hypothetical protein
MKVDANTIEELFTASGEQESDLRMIDQLIVETAPELKRQLFSGPSITMLGYGEMTWESKSSSGVWPLIGVAPQKGNISIYVAAERDGVPLAQIYNKQRLGKVNNGKNCIRFNRLEDVKMDELRNAILDAIKWSRVQERMYGRNCAQPVSEE